uniref:Tyrosine-protein kinase ephrin type A/B receptor-like domain-containing protein n=1 Tax=Tetradesmus obliquus TaxID=3088 RepID=A0A383WDU4_TETOB|eukprot:jgi/Sobl393_1/5358/SZX75777.1
MCHSLQRGAACARLLAAFMLAMAMPAICVAAQAAAPGPSLGGNLPHAAPKVPLSLPQAAAAAAAAPRLKRPVASLVTQPKAAPMLGPSSKTPRKAAAGPMQASACRRIPPSANSTEVCNMAAVTIIGCMYSCWNRNHTDERCACCWQGQQLVNNSSCEPCPVGSFARSGWNSCQACRPGTSTASTGSVFCNVCAPGYGVPPSVFPQPVWKCSKCPVGFYSGGNSTQSCSKCDDGFTTAAAGAMAAAECIPAVCNSLPPAVAGVASWPVTCSGASSCAAECSDNWTGTVSVLCGPNGDWLPPKQTCQPQQPGSEDITGVLSIALSSVIVKSKAQIVFSMRFNASLSAAAGPVKLFSCSAAGDPLQLLTDMQLTASGGSSYSASLDLQGTPLGSVSSSPGVLHFTAVVGADNRATGATAKLQLLPGCADGPAATPPEGGRPWDATACASSATGQQCFTTCDWPAYDGGGYFTTCLSDGTWSAAGGFCFARACRGSPGPEWADSGCAGRSVGSNCTEPCGTGQQGIGYVAECTIGGWQVTARDCSDVPTTCSLLPTANAPAGSKGWNNDCAGRGNGEFCQALCDGLNAYFGQGYSALCQDGQWTVQPGGRCQVCASSQPFAPTGAAVNLGETSGLLGGVVVTNDGSKVLVADTWNNRIAVYSAQNLQYQERWGNVHSITGVAQAPGVDGNVFGMSWDYLSAYTQGTGYLYEFKVTDGSAVTTHNPTNNLYELMATDSAGRLYAANPDTKYVTRWDTNDNFARKDLKPNDGSTFAPLGVAVDARTNKVLATDNSNGRVVAFNSNGDFIGTLISGLPSGNLGGLAVDATGNIYVALRTTPSQLLKFDSSARLLGKFGGLLTGPWGVAVGRGGTVWVTEASGSAHKITCM